MLHASLKLRTLLVGAAITLVAAACGGAQGAGSGGSASISFATPTDGAEVSIPFDVTLESSVTLGTPESGNHHAHLYFDSGTDAADYDIVYGTSWHVTRPLAPGTHRLTVALANPDHSLAGPTSSITITVAGAAPGASGDSPGASSAPGGPSAAPSGGSPAVSPPGYSY